MRNAIEYFYNFPSITIHEYKDKITFNINGDDYHLILNNRNYQELEEIYNIVTTWNNYYKIIKNKNNSIITNINNREYILIKVNNNHNSPISVTDLLFSPNIIIERYKLLKRDNWNELLQRKIDYFLYQRDHIRKKYLIIDEVLDYYIGMTENSIAYINSANSIVQDSNQQNITISHKRIRKDEKNELYNPLNIIIDHKARDISEYLKLLFLNNQVSSKKQLITNLIINLRFNEYDYRLLIARMLYPSFFFDIYENIINNTHNEQEIMSIIKRIKEYEEYLKYIYNIILHKIKIPKIEWIFK